MNAPTQPVRKGVTGMPTTFSFLLGSAGVIACVAIAWLALTSESVPIVGSPRGAIIAIAVVGMAACMVAGIGQAPIIGWTHPLSIFGIVFGVLALIVAGAGILGWDGLLQPVAGFVPTANGIAATTERLAIGVLTAMIVLKWIAGIPLALLVSGAATP
ncbi:MAG TPA: hypothetical protein VH371_04430 [Candidatus Limnocylindrales bacterium]|jgi:hypothetical protein